MVKPYSIVLHFLHFLPHSPQTLRTIAGVPGLEPRLNEPESLGLPITPYPTTIDALTPILEGLRIAELFASFERGGPLERRLNSGQRGLRAEQLHRFKERRRDMAASNSNTKGAKCNTGLKTQLLDQSLAKHLFN